MFRITFNKKQLPLIKLFIKFNIILKVKQKDGIIIIWPNTARDKVNFTTLKLLYKTTNKRPVKLTTFKKMEAVQHASIYILLSSHGLITNLEAIRKKISGIMFCRIS